MAGFASIFGPLLQVVLIVVVARLVYAWWQRRNLAAAPSYAASNSATAHSFGGFGGTLSGARSAPSGEPLSIAKSDYDAFERLLGEIQTPIPRKTLWVCAPWLLPRCYPTFLRSSRPTLVAV